MPLPSSVTPAVDPRNPVAPGRRSVIHLSIWRRRPSRSDTCPSITCTNMCASLHVGPGAILVPPPRDRNSLGVMQQAFVFETVAVLVRTWHEPMDPPERGARVEVRLLADEPWRGTRSAAQKVVIDEPAFRADLFDQGDGPPGNLRSAHFPPPFPGVEPRDPAWARET